MLPQLCRNSHTREFSIQSKLYFISLFIVSFIPLCYGFPSYVLKFPNSPHYCEIGGVVRGPDSYSAFGHSDCNQQAGRGKYSQIGFDFMDFGREWNLPFCLHDSDGDGYTNGEELGDPCCVYIPGQIKSPLIHDFTRSDPSSGKSVPEGSSCASLDLPVPNIEDIRLLAGKDKIQLVLPDFMAQKDRACMCKSLITIVPSQTGIPTRRLDVTNATHPPISAVRFWSLSKGSRSSVLRELEASGIENPKSLLPPLPTNGHSMNITELSTHVASHKQLWSRPVSESATSRILSPLSAISDSLKGLIPPEEWRRDAAMYDLMDDLQPDGLHFPVILTEASPVVCTTSIPDKVTDLSPILATKSARIRVQFRNWQGSGPASTIEVPVIESPNVDSLPCSTFDISEIPEVKDKGERMDPMVKASILLAILFGLFLIVSGILRCMRPTGAVRHFCLRQRFIRWGRGYISSELLLAFFATAVIIDLIYLTTVVMIDPSRADKTAFHNIGVAAGYGASIALASTTLLAARRHNIFHLSEPGTFEKGVKYHIILGHIAMIMVIVHGVVKLIDSKFDFNRSGILSGFLSGLAMLVSYIGTINFIRYKCYEVFRLLHILMPVGLGLGIWHLVQMSDGRHIGSTISLVILGTSIGLYVIDKVLSGVRDWLFKPAEVTLVRLGYTPGLHEETDQHEHILMRIKQENETFLAGQWVHVWIPALGLVSHPFSVMPTTRDYDDLEVSTELSTMPNTPTEPLEKVDDPHSHEKRPRRESRTRASLRINVDGLDNIHDASARAFVVESPQSLDEDEQRQQGCLIRRKKAGFRGQFELIIRVQPDVKRFGFYTPWTRRLYNLLSHQVTGVFDVLNSQLGTLTKSQAAVERSQSTLGKLQFEAALQSKIFITRAYGPTHLNRTIQDADSIVVIAGGSGISAILGDLAVLPLDKLNMFYWTFRCPFLLEWLYPQFANVPAEKRRLFCKSFTSDYELFETPTKRKTGHLRSEVLSQSMNIENEIANSAVRALSQWTSIDAPSTCGSTPRGSADDSNGSPNTNCKEKLLGAPPASPSTTRSSSTTTVADFTSLGDGKPQRKPSLLVLFCGPPPLKTALIQACKNERKRNRVNLILEVQSLSF